MKISVLSCYFIVLLCVGCSDPVKDAETELRMIEASDGTLGEVCTAHKKLAAAVLETHDLERYRLTKSIADTHCTSSDLIGASSKVGNAAY